MRNVFFSIFGPADLLMIVNHLIGIIISVVELGHCRSWYFLNASLVCSRYYF